MKNKTKKLFVVTMLLVTLALPVLTTASSPERHVAYRYVWGVTAVTEWSGVRHYTRAWVEPRGTDSGRVWDTGVSKATAYGDPFWNTAQSRYGR